MSNCLVCSHFARPDIDREILAERPVRLLAEDYQIAFNLLYDHATNHTSKPAPDFLEVPAQTHVQQLLSTAAPDSRSVTHNLYARHQSQSLPAMTRLLALSAKLPPSPKAKGFSEKAWWETRARLVETLQRFPDALQAVIDSLRDCPPMFY